MQMMQNLNVDIVEEKTTVVATVTSDTDKKIKVLEQDLVGYIEKKLKCKLKPAEQGAYRNYVEETKVYVFEVIKKKTETPKQVKKAVTKKKAVPTKETPKPTEG